LRGVLAAVALACCSLTAGLRAQALPEHATSRVLNTSLGVECTHCHVGTNYADRSKPALDFARRMQRMVQGLNDGPLRPLGGVTCWSCHRGHAIPARLPRADWESIATTHSVDFANARDGLGLTMSVYTASLGVNCGHCHVEGDWTNASRPAHRTVTLMSTLFDLIPTYFDEAVRMPRTQCYMCHQGRTRIERAPA